MIGPKFPIRRPAQTPPWNIIPKAIVGIISSEIQKEAGAIHSNSNTQREARSDSPSFPSVISRRPQSPDMAEFLAACPEVQQGCESL